MITLFFGYKRIAVFKSHYTFHLYLVERGIPHTYQDGEVGLWEAEGYWYD